MWNLKHAIADLHRPGKIIERIGQHRGMNSIFPQRQNFTPRHIRSDYAIGSSGDEPAEDIGRGRVVKKVDVPGTAGKPAAKIRSLTRQSTELFAIAVRFVEGRSSRNAQDSAVGDAIGGGGKI